MLAILKPLLVIALVAFFFGPLLLRLWRTLAGESPKAGGRDRTRGSRSDLPPPAGEPTVGTYCPHCGKPLPADARYCCHCGRDVSCIDV